MRVEDIKAIFDNAEAKRREADAARAAMSDVMLQAMRNLLPEGSILKLDQRPLPVYLVRVRTLMGNDRGTRTFRVARVVCVEANPVAPELSHWECEAIPVSEKTGKDMSGKTHGGNSRATVRLRGDMGYAGPDENLSESADRLIKLVADHATQAA